MNAAPYDQDTVLARSSDGDSFGTYVADTLRMDDSFGIYVADALRMAGRGGLGDNWGCAEPLCNQRISGTCAPHDAENSASD